LIDKPSTVSAPNRAMIVAMMSPVPRYISVLCSV
jgi:hypothetical protein